jgi:hypothetical protein
MPVPQDSIGPDRAYRSSLSPWSQWRAGELLVKLTPTKVVSAADVAD